MRLEKCVFVWGERGLNIGSVVALEAAMVTVCVGKAVV